MIDAVEPIACECQSRERFVEKVIETAGVERAKVECAAGQRRCRREPWRAEQRVGFRAALPLPHGFLHGETEVRAPDHALVARHTGIAKSVKSAHRRKGRDGARRGSEFLSEECHGLGNGSRVGFDTMQHSVRRCIGREVRTGARQIRSEIIKWCDAVRAASQDSLRKMAEQMLHRRDEAACQIPPVFQTCGKARMLSAAPGMIPWPCKSPSIESS